MSESGRKTEPTLVFLKDRTRLKKLNRYWKSEKTKRENGSNMEDSNCRKHLQLIRLGNKEVRLGLLEPWTNLVTKNIKIITNTWNNHPPTICKISSE